jgi:hypothetical protein
MPDAAQAFDPRVQLMPCRECAHQAGTQTFIAG